MAYNEDFHFGSRPECDVCKRSKWFFGYDKDTWDDLETQMYVEGWRRIVTSTGLTCAHFCSEKCEQSQTGQHITNFWWAKRELPYFIKPLRAAILDLLLGR